MLTEREPHDPSRTPWLIGGGEMGKVILAKDWSQTPLGPLQDWPPSLRTTVSLALNSNFPISLAWGPEHTQIYNDGYWPICGDKHPDAMGQDFSVCWASAFPVIGDAFRSALAGTTAFLRDQRMFLDRLGFLEETFFTFSFSPIRDETGAVAGLFHPVTETTGIMLAERWARTLRDIAALDVKTLSIDAALALAAEALGAAANDVPFAAFYRIDPDRAKPALVASVGLASGAMACLAALDLGGAEGDSPQAGAAPESSGTRLLELGSVCPGLLAGPYPEPIQRALRVPLCLAGQDRPTAIMIAGCSTRLPLSEGYRSFFDLLGAAIAALVANAAAFEEERRRADALAAIDRAKTLFFSNVSHEFRTPLTLLLGPLEDELADLDAGLPPRSRERLLIAHRNGLRLLKLVNTLLDFARIEAGKMQAEFVPTDLSAFTAELAGNFRSACAQANLDFRVDCPPLSRPVNLDQDMWEKVVLNLLSNAFKFTLAGGIEVTLREREDQVELQVRDSGAGIPAEELPRVFERFHRIKDTPGRSHEGTGIGLALTRELVGLHGGTLEVSSVQGQGSTFTVILPLGQAAGGDRVEVREPRPGSSVTRLFLEEIHLLVPEPAQPALATAALSGRPKILVADDNADMRRYVVRLLADEYEVEAVADGEAALAAVRRAPPALVLSDIMMPRLDGIGLLRALRAIESLRTLPVILLSARAGEEERIKGLAVGADDYLTKPFTARELRARVRAHVELAQLRLRFEREQMDEVLRDSERTFRNLAEAMPQIVWTTDAAGKNNYFNQKWVEYTGMSLDTSYGDGWTQPFHPEDRKRAWDAWQKAIATCGSYALECRLRGADGVYRWWLIRGVPQIGPDGTVEKWFGTCTDIEAMKQQETELRQSEENLAITLHSIGDGVIVTDLAGRVTRMNPTAERLTGWTWAEAQGRPLVEVFHIRSAQDGRSVDNPVDLVFARGQVVGLANHTLLLARNGQRYQISDSAAPIRNSAGEIVGVVLVFSDITQQYETQASLEATLAMLNRTGAIARIGGWELVLETQALAWSGEIFHILEADPAMAPSLDWGQHLPGWGERSVLQRLRQAAIDQGTPWAHEFPLTTAKGRVRWVREQGSAIQAEGRVVRLVGTLQDITERRQVEEERRLLEAQVLKNQKMDSLGSLAGGVAHDMNNVLGAILALAAVHARRAEPGSALDHDMATISAACQRGGNLVKGLLSFARQELAEDREVDLNEVIRGEAKLLERTTLQKVRLVLELDPDLRAVKGDAAALHHSLMNLCVNAVDAMPDGGTLTLRTANEPGGTVLLEVADTGVGMPKAVLSKALDPFFSTKPTGQGTGLGLSIVYGTVKTHHGTLDLLSEPGEGTRVLVRLPAYAGAAAKAGGTAPALATPAGRSLSVLVVDDDELILESIPLLIQAMGHTAACAAGGEAAEAQLQAGLRPDVIILDMNMPGLDGRATLPRLRRICPSVPVLLATGRADQAALDLVINHPGVSLLAKPFDWTELNRHLLAATT